MACKKTVKWILAGISFLFTISTSFALSAADGIQLYQNDSHLVPEHKEKLAADIQRYHHADNLWDVLRDEFTLPHYEDVPLVQEKIEWFMNNQDFLLRSATRAAPYLYFILQQVKKRHLPAELVLLPIVESGYNPFSLSPVGAAGVWQLMPSTATGLGVRQDGWFDGRRDVITSTRAALNYLAYLQSFFDGNWLLAIAAYNTGEGNVLAAIKRNIREGRDTDFWSLPVAQETHDYVPSLLALAVIISHPDRYPVYFPPVRNAPYLAQVDVGTQISLKYAAMLAGISDQKMKQLNPGFTHTLTSNHGHSKLTLPIENVEKFTENLSLSPFGRQPQINWIHYRVRLGDTLALVAKKFGTTPTAIRKLNHLSSKTTISRGNNLLIPLNKNKSAPMETSPSFAFDQSTKTKIEETISKFRTKPKQQAIASNKIQNQYSLEPGDTVYMVRAKDTIASIAKRFHINKHDLQTANQLRNRKIVPGERIIIPTHARQLASTETHSHAAHLSPGDTLYMVRRGDTIAKIAKRFHITPAEIRLANLTDDSAIHEGDRIVIPTGSQTRV